MHNPGQIPPFIEPEALHINGTLEDFNNSLNLYLDQNKMILDPEVNETGLSQKIVRMPKEHLLAYLQQFKSFSEMLWAENWSLIEQNEELKTQIQGFSDSVNEENCEAKPEVKTEEQEESPESPCNCLVCKLFETGEIIIEEENEGNIETDKKLVDRLSSFMKKQQQNMMEDEEEHQKLLKNFEQLEAAKLSTDKKLIEVEVKNQQLLKSLDELKTDLFISYQKSADFENQNQQLLNNLEELKAEKLIVDEKLAQKEDQYLFIEKELAKVEEKNRELLKDIEELKTGRLAIKVLQKYNDEMKNQNQLLLKDLETMKAAKAIGGKRTQELLMELKATHLKVAQKQAQIEERNQESLKNSKDLKHIQKKLTKAENRIQELLEDQQVQAEERYLEIRKNSKELKKKLAEAENRNQELFNKFEVWERDILYNKENNVKARVDLAKKTQELTKVIKEKEEISLLLEQKSQELKAFQSKSRMPTYFEQEKLLGKLKNDIIILESVNESLRDQISTFRVKVSNLLYQMSWPSKLVGAAFKFNLREENCINLNLKQLTECIPKLKLAIQRLILSNPHTLETDILRDILNQNQNEREDKEENKENGFLKQILSPINTMNAKRNFEAVGDGFKKQDNVFNTKQKDQGDSLDYEQPIIKKLKNN